MALIKFYKPALFRKDMDAVLQTMVDEKIGPGDRKKEFISSFCNTVGKKFGLALRSYNDMIASSLSSLGVEEGDSVILSVLTPKVYLDVLKSNKIKQQCHNIKWQCYDPKYRKPKITLFSCIHHKTIIANFI
jgi:dTDP-4-amino-4,6-dideoxygalactose transaminase